MLAKGGDVRNRRAYIGRVLGDPKQARTYAPGSAAGPAALTPREIAEHARRPGGPSDHVAEHAAQARRQLAEHARPLAAATDPPPAAKLTGEALARAQLAEIEQDRRPIEPVAAAVPADDDDEPDDDAEPAEPADAEIPF